MEIHQDLTLAADIMFINNIPFLLTTSRNIQFTTVERLPSQKKRDILTAITKVIHLYQRRGFSLSTCLMDNKFATLRGPLFERKIALNTCAPGEHVPEIERKIQTVKEQVHGIITTLPFQQIPTLIVINAVIFSVMWLNFFPPAGGVSTTLFPQTIVTGLHANHNKHCKISFGSYAQAHKEPSSSNNAMVSQTVGRISIGPTGNIQRLYRFLSLLPRCQFIARAFTPLPMPSEVIRQVEMFTPKEIHSSSLGTKLGLPTPRKTRTKSRNSMSLMKNILIWTLKITSRW
jgi:hypothetical protein